MAVNTRRTRERVDANGVRVRRRAGVRGGVWLALAACAAVAALLLVIAGRRGAPPDTDSARAAPPAPLAAAPAEGAARRPMVPPRRSDEVVPPREAVPPTPPAVAPAVPPAGDAGAAAAVAADGGPPQKEDAPFTQGEPGERSGIALFPPPGTKPVKVGILVPEDFDLPPGYIRHYQATDDGQRVPAILMFHPDYHPVDANGEPIALPADRVVPPDMAPPGMPIQMLEPPPEPSGDDPGVH